jgi:hypothetical protein
MNNQLYDTMKWLVRYALPALAVLVLAVSDIWGVPYGPQIVGTIAAFTSFLSLIMALGIYKYNQGMIPSNTPRRITALSKEELLYDVLAWVAQYLLPASATLYFALSEIWSFPHIESVVATIMALGGFLSVLLGISTKQYKDFISGTRQTTTLGLLVDLDILSLRMPNTVYDALRWTCQILLPASGALYFALAQAWDLPYAEQIVATVVAACAFLGVILGISSARFKRG